MRKTLIVMSTLLLLMLSGCSSEIKDLRKSVATINNEVKRTVSLYEESLKEAEALGTQIEPLLDPQAFLSSEDPKDKSLTPHFENLYSFYNNYVEEVKSYDIMYEGKAEEGTTEEISIQIDTLSDYTDVRYYYDDVSNILEQMYITSLPNGNTFLISLEWYKGELIKHEEMVSY